MSPRIPVFAAAAALVLLACDTPLTPLGDTIESHPIVESPPVQTNAVDLLWVIDSSASMADEQAELASKFDALIDELTSLGADFHIGVVTTDITAPGQAGILQDAPGFSPSRGCLAPGDAIAAECAGLDLSNPFLSYGDYADADGVVDSARLQRDFRCIASVGTCGAFYERGIEAVRLALSEQNLSGPNQGFLRSDAFLAVVFLTDEDDCSSGGALTPQEEADCYVAETRDQLLSTSAIYDELIALKGGDATRVLIGGIIGPTDPAFPNAPTRSEYRDRSDRDALFSCNSPLGDGTSQGARDGMRYRELIDLAGDLGVEESICRADFTAALQTIGQVIRRSFDYNCLPSNPRPETCTSDTDCPGELTCVNPGSPAVGESYCSDFEISVSLSFSGPAGPYDVLSGPGSAAVNDPTDAAFSVDYDAVQCPEGIAFSFSDGYRPPPGAVFRVSYIGVVDVIDDANVATGE